MARQVSLKKGRIEMKLQRLAVSLVVGLGVIFTATAAWADVYLDAEGSGDVTASGYVRFLGTYRWDQGSQISLGGGVEAAWLDYVYADSRDRGAPDALLRDFLNFSSGQVETMEIRGLAAGAYDLTFYSWDNSWPDKHTLFEVDEDNDSIVDHSPTVDNTASQQQASVSIDVSAAGVLSITVQGTAGRGGVFNGLDLVASGGPPNQAPTVDAGSNQTITLPTDTVSLDGTVGDDGLPNPPAAVTTTWTKQSGPGTVTFGNAGAVDTTATFGTDGVYVLKLEADDSELTASDTVTITVNPELQPTVQFDATSSSGDESVSTVNLSVSLSGSYSQAVTVDYAATGGTAASPGDYSISGTQLTFDPGVTSQNIVLTVVDDGDEESDETVELTLSGPVNAILGANTVHTYTIVDNDAGGPGVSVYLDIEVSGSVTAAGYDSLTKDHRWDRGTQASLGGGIEAGWLDRYGGSSRDRGASYPDLTRDFLQIKTNNAPETLKIAGLTPGAYDLTLYAIDHDYSDKRSRFEIDQDNDGTIDVTVEIHAPNGEDVKTVSVDISSAGILSITLDDAGFTAVCNGLDLVGVGGPTNQAPTADAGSNWQYYDSSNGLFSHDIASIYSDGSRLWLGIVTPENPEAGNYLAFTDDDGFTWDTLLIDTAYEFTNPIFDIAGSDSLLLFTSKVSGLYGSFDNGATWQNIYYSIVDSVYRNFINQNTNHYFAAAVDTFHTDSIVVWGGTADGLMRFVYAPDYARLNSNNISNIKIFFK